MIGIYKITETATGLSYIGQSIRMEKRWKDHRARFSPDTHNYELLMTCTAEALNRMERFCIQAWNTMVPNGLNQTIGGNGTFGPGKSPSANVRRRISESLKGIPHSEERCRNISEAKKGKKIGPMSEETRHRISEAQKKRFNKDVNNGN